MLNLLHARSLETYIDILIPMRRWIAILLLIVLPLQLTWAVAANYCQDESGSGVRHFGHHLHGHQGGVGSAKGAAKGGVKDLVKGKQQADRDCGCGGHLCGAHLLPTRVEAKPAPGFMRRHALIVFAPMPSIDPTRIERPNWTVSL